MHTNLGRLTNDSNALLWRKEREGAWKREIVENQKSKARKKLYTPSTIQFYFSNMKANVFKERGYDFAQDHKT